MKNSKLKILFAAFLFFLFSNYLFAHCDSINGPVVKASVKALETGNVNYVLIWVRPEDENEIINMFEKVNKVRQLGQDAKELADMYFFETVARIHRMAEGVGYTGLKSADYKPEEGIEAADAAIEKESLENILTNIDEKYHSNVISSFKELLSRKNYKLNDLAAGREYVESYVHFIHYIEELYNGENSQIKNKHNH